MKRGLEHQIDDLRSNPDAFNTAEHETIFHHLLEPKGQKQTTIVHEVIGLIAAGSDTTASTCYVGMFYALRNKEICLKLTKELNEAWPDKDQPMSYVALEKLPYLVCDRQLCPILLTFFPADCIHQRITLGFP